MANHPHSVQYIGSCINQLSADVSEVLILMNLVKGGQLLDIMNRHIGHGFDEQEVLKIFCDVCLAVTRLHHRTRPIIHRDLKVCHTYPDVQHYLYCESNIWTSLCWCVVLNTAVSIEVIFISKNCWERCDITCVIVVSMNCVCMITL